MTTQDEFRKNAEQAQRRADMATTDRDRTLWLRLAQGWASLLTTRPQTAQESFDEQVADKGTGQDENKSQN
jgi:hypothetical protein